jgi:hypothetical protein
VTETARLTRRSSRYAGRITEPYNHHKLLIWTRDALPQALVRDSMGWERRARLLGWAVAGLVLFTALLAATTFGATMAAVTLSQKVGTQAGGSTPGVPPALADSRTGATLRVGGAALTAPPVGFDSNSTAVLEQYGDLFVQFWGAVWPQLPTDSLQLRHRLEPSIVADACTMLLEGHRTVAVTHELNGTVNGHVRRGLWGTCVGGAKP